MGLLDAEFEAFQSGLSLENGPLASDPISFHRPANSSHAELAQTRAPDWASDFQRLHIFGAQAQFIPLSEFQEQDPSHRATQEGWHNEFLNQEKSVPDQDLYRQTPGINRGYIPSNNTYGAFDQIYAPVPLETKQRPTDPSKLSPNDAALERAFDAVSKELKHSEEREQGQKTEHGHEASLMDDLSGMYMQSSELRGAVLTEPIGSDRILDEVPKPEREQQARNDADELARTAGELLENLKHDHSQKFRESNFLSLMRQLRDREVQVEGDKIVDVSIPLSQS